MDLAHGKEAKELFAESLITDVMKDAFEEFYTRYPLKANNCPHKNDSDKDHFNTHKNEGNIESFAEIVVSDIINESYTEFYSSHKNNTTGTEHKQQKDHYPPHTTSAFTQKLIDEVIESCIKQFNSQKKDEQSIESYADSIVDQTLNEAFKYFYEVHNNSHALSARLAEDLINETLKEYYESHSKTA